MKRRHKIIAAVAVTAAVGAGIVATHHTLGVANPDITQSNIFQTICNPSWSTKSIRPPTSYTGPLKAKLCQEQNCGDSSKYELDHRIALTDGGAPSDPNNLWLQPYEPRPGAHEKDRLEVIIHDKICAGAITLKQGQDMLTGDWVSYYNQFTSGTFGSVDNAVDTDDD